MGWFKQCLLWIIISAVYVSCQELTSTLPEGNNVCPGKEVIFTCAIRGSQTLRILILAWSSSEYIGQSNFLQFTTEDDPGADETSIINGNVVATLTSSTTVDGVPVLESQLHIIPVQPSTVICHSVTNGSAVNEEFFISAIPGVPRNIRATESQRIENICIIRVTWSPPAGSDGSDIDHYKVYVPSRDIVRIESSAETNLIVQDCRDDIRIHVAAVNRFDCAGMNSSEIQPILFPNPPTAEGGSTTTTTEDGSSSTNFIAAAVVGAILFVLLLMITITIIIMFFIFYERGKKKAKKGGLQVFLIQDELKELYKALKLQSDEKIQVYARSLSRKLKKKSSNETIKVALKTALEEIQLESGIGIQNALNKMKGMITDSDMGNIDEEFEANVKRLCTKAEKEQHAEVLNDLIKEVDRREIQPAQIIEILLKLCVELQKTSQELPPQGKHRRASVEDIEDALEKFAKAKATVEDVLVRKIQDDLEDLYHSLKSLQSNKIQVTARYLSRSLKKESSKKNIKAALITALEQIQMKSGEDIQTALNKMKSMIPAGSIDEKFEARVNHLCTEAGKDQHMQVLKDLIEEVNRREVQPDHIIEVLMKLCEKLQESPRDQGANPFVIQGKGANAWQTADYEEIELVEHH